MLLDAVVEAMLTPKTATITKVHEIYITKSTAADPDVKLAVKNVTWATMNVAEINGVLGSLYRNPYKPNMYGDLCTPAINDVLNTHQEIITFWKRHFPTPVYGGPN